MITYKNYVMGIFYNLNCLPKMLNIVMIMKTNSIGVIHIVCMHEGGQRVSSPMRILCVHGDGGSGQMPFNIFANLKTTLSMQL